MLKRQLFEVSRKGTWNEWLSYFLGGVAVQSLDVLSRAQRINALILDWQLKVGPRNAGVDQEMIKLLAVNPYITIKKTAENIGVAFTTAQRAISKLENLGLIQQVSEGKRDKVYCAGEIMHILNEPTKISENQEGILLP